MRYFTDRQEQSWVWELRALETYQKQYQDIPLGDIPDEAYSAVTTARLALTQAMRRGIAAHYLLGCENIRGASIAGLHYMHSIYSERGHRNQAAGDHMSGTEWPMITAAFVA